MYAEFVFNPPPHFHEEDAALHIFACQLSALIQLQPTLQVSARLLCSDACQAGKLQENHTSRE